MTRNPAKEQLLEIADWRLEAKEEDSARYFYAPPELRRISTGGISYVIGRKGSGKTAVAEHINGLEGWDTAIQNLSFKSFPFNLLYEFEDKRFTTPSQYTTVWLYIIYCAICSMLAKRDDLNNRVTTELREHFSPGFEAAISETRKIDSGKNFSFTILELLGGGYSTGTTAQKNEMPLHRRVEILEKLIAEVLDDRKYYVLFDELDEDYEDILNVDRSSLYFDLLIGLFKAVASVRAKFGRQGILPVIFLRDDIYSLLRNNDKNKWADSALNLQWTEDSLNRLLAFRLLRARNPNETDISLEKAQQSVFLVDTIRLKNRRGERREVIKYMLARTMMRPRDVVSYMRECANVALQRDMYGIDGNVIKAGEFGYSNRFRGEMVDEIQSIIPNVDLIFDELSNIRKQILTLAEFETAIVLVKEKLECDLPVETISEVMFNFSVFGNVASQRSNRIFKYNHPQAVLNRSEQIIVHQGLQKSLRLL